jgi:iron-sulfur cluster assembly accessory protein
MELSILPAAEKFIQRMLRFGGGEHCGFRLVVTPGGCSGLNSEFSVEAAPQPGEVVFEQGGLRLFLPAESAALLEGASMDFVDTATTSGLVFQIANKEACACSSASAMTPGVVTVGSIERRPAPASEA